MCTDYASPRAATIDHPTRGQTTPRSCRRRRRSANRHPRQNARRQKDLIRRLIGFDKSVDGSFVSGPRGRAFAQLVIDIAKQLVDFDVGGRLGQLRQRCTLSPAFSNAMRAAFNAASNASTLSELFGSLPLFCAAGSHRWRISISDLPLIKKKHARMWIVGKISVDKMV